MGLMVCDAVWLFVQRPTLRTAILLNIGAMFVASAIVSYSEDSTKNTAIAANNLERPETELSVFVDCHLDTVPAENNRIYTLDLFPVPIEAGGGGFVERSALGNAPLEWPKDRNGISTQRYKCTLINYSNNVIFNLSFSLNLRFINVNT
jgi:hypothetical protein